MSYRSSRADSSSHRHLMMGGAAGSLLLLMAQLTASSPAKADAVAVGNGYIAAVGLGFVIGLLATAAGKSIFSHLNKR